MGGRAASSGAEYLTLLARIALLLPASAGDTDERLTARGWPAVGEMGLTRECACDVGEIEAMEDMGNGTNGKIQKMHHA